MEIVIILTLIILLSATQVQGCKPLDILDSILHKLVTMISQLLNWLLVMAHGSTETPGNNDCLKRLDTTSQNRRVGPVEVVQQPDVITFTVPNGYGIWRVVGSDANGDFTIFIHDNSEITPATISLRRETALGDHIHNQVRVDWIEHSNKQTGYVLITVSDWLAQ